MNWSGSVARNFLLDVNFAWNNELLVFDPTGEGEWSRASVSGSVPVPRACSSAVYMADRGCALIFGGRHRDTRLNDLYLLDMESFVYSEIITLSPEQPVGRSWCSLSPVGPSSMILFGGCSSEGIILGDLWRLELSYDANKNCFADWKSVDRPKTTKHTVSFWHTAAVANGYLLVHGGSQVPPQQSGVIPASVAPRRIAPPPLVAISLAHTYNYWHDSMSLSTLLPSPLREFIQIMKECVSLRRGDEPRLMDCKLSHFMNVFSLNF